MHTLSGEQRDSSTHGSSTTSTSNTMNIVLRIIGIIVVQHMSDVFDILSGVSISKTRSSKNGAQWRPCEVQVAAVCIALYIALCIADHSFMALLVLGITTCGSP